MTPQSHRDRYRLAWRALAQEALACAGDLHRDLGDLLREATASRHDAWLSPNADPGDGRAIGAFGEIARAFAHQRRVGDRAAMAGALRELAAHAMSILERSPTSHSEDLTPSRPYRADIDG